VSDVLKILLPLPDASKKSEILMSSPFKNELRGPKILESCQRPQKNVKSLLNKENHTPEPHSHDQETECIICGESFDEEWIQYNNVKSGLKRHMWI